MDIALIQIVCIILLVLGIVGTFLPVLPGLLLSLAGLLIYKFGTDAPLSMIYVWIFVFLTVMSVVLNYVIPARTNRKSTTYIIAIKKTNFNIICKKRTQLSGELSFTKK